MELVFVCKLILILFLNVPFIQADFGSGLQPGGFINTVGNVNPNSEKVNLKNNLDTEIDLNLLENKNAFDIKNSGNDKLFQSRLEANRESGGETKPDIEEAADHNVKDHFANMDTISETQTTKQNMDTILPADIPDATKEEIIKQYLIKEMHNPVIPTEDIQHDEKQKVIRHLLSNVLSNSDDGKNHDNDSEKMKLDETELSAQRKDANSDMNDTGTAKETSEKLDELKDEDQKINEAFNSKQNNLTNLIAASMDDGIRDDMKSLIDGDFKLKTDMKNKDDQKNLNLEKDMKELLNQDIKLKKDLIDKDNKDANAKNHDRNSTNDFLESNKLDGNHFGNISDESINRELKTVENSNQINAPELSKPPQNENFHQLTTRATSIQTDTETIFSSPSPLISILRGNPIGTNEEGSKENILKTDFPFKNTLSGENKFAVPGNVMTKKKSDNDELENKTEPTVIRNDIPDQTSQGEDGMSGHEGQKNKTHEGTSSSGETTHTENNGKLAPDDSDMSQDNNTMAIQVLPTDTSAVDLNIVEEAKQSNTENNGGSNSDISTSHNNAPGFNTTTDPLMGIPNNFNNGSVFQDMDNNIVGPTDSTGLTMDQIKSLSDQDLLQKLEENQRIDPEMLKKVNSDPDLMHEILSSPQHIPHIEPEINYPNESGNNSVVNNSHFTSAPVAELLANNPFTNEVARDSEFSPRVLKSMSDAELQVALIALLASMNPNQTNQINLKPSGYGTFLTFIGDIDLNIELVPIQSNPLTRKNAKEMFKEVSKAVSKAHSKLPPGSDEIIKAVISATIPGGSEAIAAGELIAQVVKKQQANKKQIRTNDPSVE